MTRLQRSFIIILAASLVLGLCQNAFAVGAGGMGARSLTVENDVFLGGNYIELGISATGSFGTKNIVPTKEQPDSSGIYYHPNSTDVRGQNAGRLGLRSNSQGWETNGTQNPDETKDFFLPGIVDEGFLIGWATDPNADAETKAVGSEIAGNSQISGASTTDDSTVSLLKATTTGTADNTIAYTQVVSFHPDDKAFRTDITLKNVTDSPVYKLTYVRRFDPDQNVRSNMYMTDNAFFKDEAGTAWTIASTSQFPDGNIDLQTVLTSAAYPFCFFANDRRAESTYGNIEFTSIPTADRIGDSIYGTHRWGDIAIGHLTNLGTLPAHASVTFTYYSSLDSHIYNAYSNFEDVTMSITQQPVARTFIIGEISGTLRVLGEKLIDGKAYTDLQYQWYKGSGMTPDGGTLIAGATGWDFEIPTDLRVGTYFYYCVVRDPSSDLAVTSCVANISVVPVGCTIYTVNFNANMTDATVTGMPAKQTVAENSQLVDPGMPHINGYRFEGWFLEAECTNLWNFSDPVNAAFTLYAKWERSFTATDPVDCTVNAAEPASFSTTVTAAVGNIEYQWQERVSNGTWSDIPCMTSTYTIASTSLSDNGKSFRCKITVSTPTQSDYAYTNAALLTVNASPQTTPPHTGDRSMPLLWIGICLLAGIGVLAFLRVRRKHA